MSADLDPQLVEQLQALAARQGCSPAQLLEQALRRHLRAEQALELDGLTQQLVQQARAAAQRNTERLGDRP